MKTISFLLTTGNTAGFFAAKARLSTEAWLRSLSIFARNTLTHFCLMFPFFVYLLRIGYAIMLFPILIDPGEDGLLGLNW
jgi:hypothetical protein